MRPAAFSSSRDEGRTRQAGYEASRLGLGDIVGAEGAPKTRTGELSVVASLRLLTKKPAAAARQVPRHG
jgi:hypothetical protein